MNSLVVSAVETFSQTVRIGSSGTHAKVFLLSEARNVRLNNLIKASFSYLDSQRIQKLEITEELHQIRNHALNSSIAISHTD